MSEKECYHFTYLNRAFSINETGLEPRNEENSQGIKDNKVKVFFSEGKDGAVGLFANFYSVYKAIKSGERTEKINPVIAEKVRKSKDFEEFLGRGMHLIFDGTHIVNEKNKFDGVTENNISPNDLNVCLIRNNATGEISYSKFDFIQFLIAQMDQEKLASIPSHMQKCILEYSRDYRDKISEFQHGDYDTIQISLQEFCDKYRADITADIIKYTLTDDYVKAMIEGRADNFILREGLCGQDLRNWDMSNLSPEMFRHLCFDARTKFSSEQEEKFHPHELLNSANTPGKMIEELHRQGITGKGVKIAIIDAKIAEDEKALLEGVNVEKVDSQKAGCEEQHGITVLSALKQMAPEADITYFPYDKKSKQKDEILKEHIMKSIQRGIKIISMSTSFNDLSNENEIKALCQQNGVMLIDSATFYKDFTYCFRSTDEAGNEAYHEAFCEPETAGISEENWKKYIGLFKEYNVDINDVEKLAQKLDEKGETTKSAIVKRLSQFSDVLGLSTYDQFRQAFKQRLIEDEKKEREENKSVEIACGGRTFACGGKTENGEDNYKYWASCSASYTIPQVAGLFALARQVDSRIGYRNFVTACKDTSQKVDGRMILNPTELMETIKVRTMSGQEY